MDLNADMAEGDRWTARDRELLDTVTSASIACGFHAGNRAVMRAAAAACVERGVAIGAHFSYRDRIGFGRRDREVTTDRLAADVLEQWATLADESAARRRHGRLRKTARRALPPDGDRPRGCRRGGRGLGTPLPRCSWRHREAPSAHRPELPGSGSYPRDFRTAPMATDGELAPRTLPGAVIDDEAAVAARALTLVRRGGIATRGGRWLELRVETLCIHGDSPRAGQAARAVREIVGARRAGGPRLFRAAGRMTAPPRAVVAFGDGALLVETSGVEQAGALARAVLDRARDGQAPVGIDEAVVGFGNVVIVLDLSLDGTDPDRCAAWVEHLLTELCTGGGVPPGTPEPTTGQTHVLPVVFDGTDLDEVARRTGTSTDRVVAWLCGADLRVAFLGFAPGFPYLTGLPPELAALPRRDTPRTSVPAGSVAVGGGFASVYPRASPGGWHLLGRTDVPLFDPDVAPYALVRPGDRVRFTVAAGAARAGEPHPGPRPPLGAGDRDHLEILDPGVLSLIQDGGRRAVASLGIPRGGAADPEALVLANRLTGNPDTAAAVECTAVGPTVRIAGRRSPGRGGCGATGRRRPRRRPPCRLRHGAARRRRADRVGRPYPPRAACLPGRGGRSRDADRDRRAGQRSALGARSRAAPSR